MPTRPISLGVDLLALAKTLAALDWRIVAAAFALGAVIVLARRVPLLGTLISIAIWGGTLLLIFALVGGRAAFDPSLGPLAAAFGQKEQRIEGKELRIPMARDGHFWVRVRVGGVERRMLVDSGATITALAPDTAQAAGLQPVASPLPVMLETANGPVRALTATVPELRLGNIVARDLPVVVAPAFGRMNVLGMNFLSRLKSWRVEERTLVLVPHHPQPER